LQAVQLARVVSVLACRCLLYRDTIYPNTVADWFVRVALRWRGFRRLWSIHFLSSKIRGPLYGQGNRRAPQFAQSNCHAACGEWRCYSRSFLISSKRRV